MCLEDGHGGAGIGSLQEVNEKILSGWLLAVSDW